MLCSGWLAVCWEARGNHNMRGPSPTASCEQGGRLAGYSLRTESIPITLTWKIPHPRYTAVLSGGPGGRSLTSTHEQHTYSLNPCAWCCRAAATRPPLLPPPAVCSAGVIALDLARELLELYPNTNVLVVSHENISNAFYTGKDPSMLLINVLFRANGAAVILTNKSKYAGRTDWRGQ